jgi:putative spermidine/putrescine transport system ATP-binding protein
MTGAFDLELRHVWKRYGGQFYGVRDVSFALPHGEFLTLLGPSGSGKTTTLMMVAGFETPTRGEILLQGRSIANAPPQQRNLGVVFQGYGLFPHMSVLENVAFPLRMRGVATGDRRRKASEMLEKVGLSPFASRKPRALSGGQQQRVALARALVFDPSALLLDEPLGALDRGLREQLQLEIKAIQRRLGISVLLVTHDQDEAMMMSDRIAVMAEGRIVQIGTPSDVYLHPATKFVAGFLGETNLIPGVFQGREDGAAVMRLGGGLPSRAQMPGRAAPGEAVTVSIRPERIRILGPGQHAETMVDGVIESCVFLGRHARVIVQALGQSLIVSTLDGPAGERGSPVRLGWATSDAQCIAGDGADAPGSKEVEYHAPA